MSTYTNKNCSLWPRQARPQRAMPKAVVAGICAGIIAGISTNAVLSELPAPVAIQAVAQAPKSAEKPALASVARLTQASVAARPAPVQAASEIPAISPAKVARNHDKIIDLTDGRGIESAVDQAVAAAAAAAAATAASAPSARSQTTSAPARAPAITAAPAAEPAAKPVSRPQRVVRKRYRNPRNYSRNRNPFFPFFSGGNGFFFGGRRG